jgi:hypothetical protein
MNKKLVDGVWVVVCDWEDENGKVCDLGNFGEPKMFVDPTNGQDPDSHFQCGSHHGIIKQEDDPAFQLPEDHKLQDSTLVKDGVHPGEDVSVKLDGFKPDVEGKVWDGTKPPKE